MNNEIPTEVKYSLNKLCNQLQMFLDKTESDLFYAKERYEQAKNVLKPWKIEETAPKSKQCLCKTLETVQIEDNNEESALLSDISKTLSKAENVRKSLLKPGSLINKTKPEIKKVQKSETCLKNKPKLTTKKCTSIQTIPNNKHSPCCPLFGSNNEVKTHISLPEVFDSYKVPVVLTETIQKSVEIFNCVKKRENRSKNNPKHIFLKKLTAQNEKRYELYKDKESFFEILSILHSSEKDKHLNSNALVFYNNTESFKKFQVLKHSINKKHSWNAILCIIIDIFTNFDFNELDQMQKLYLMRMMKTICNFAHSDIPSVPIIKVVQTE